MSIDQQAKNKEGSITSQIQRLKMKVNEKNTYENGKWGKVVNIYKDQVYSGKNTDRPKVSKALLERKRREIVKLETEKLVNLVAGHFMAKGLGTYVLCQSGLLMVAGSSSVGVGGAERD